MQQQQQQQQRRRASMGELDTTSHSPSSTTVFVRTAADAAKAIAEPEHDEVSYDEESYDDYDEIEEEYYYEIEEEMDEITVGSASFVTVEESDGLFTIWEADNEDASLDDGSWRWSSGNTGSRQNVDVPPAPKSSSLPSASVNGQDEYPVGCDSAFDEDRDDVIRSPNSVACLKSLASVPPPPSVIHIGDDTPRSNNHRKRSSTASGTASPALPFQSHGFGNNADRCASRPTGASRRSFSGPTQQSSSPVNLTLQVLGTDDIESNHSQTHRQRSASMDDIHTECRKTQIRSSHRQLQPQKNIQQSADTVAPSFFNATRSVSEPHDRLASVVAQLNIQSRRSSMPNRLIATDAPVKVPMTC